MGETIAQLTGNAEAHRWDRAPHPLKISVGEFHTYNVGLHPLREV
jgi:hypothetical protein